ncbi:MAG: HTH domain-containing protein [Bacteroidales bacterium]|nr:HTH domain-containing protein [Bacteroidales bacterium]
MSETKLSERQRHILSLVLNDPTISAKRMSEMLSVNKRTIERDIDYLRKTKQIFREGSDNHGHWVVVKPE